MSRTPISLASASAALFAESSTKILNPSSTAPGLGALIMSALNNQSLIATTSDVTMSENATYNGPLLTGGSERRDSVSWSFLILVSLCVAIYTVSMIL